MTAEAISPRVRRRRAHSPFHQAIVTGLVFGVVAVYLAVVGILPMINARAIIVDADSDHLLTMAQEPTSPVSSAPTRRPQSCSTA